MIWYLILCTTSASFGTTCLAPLPTTTLRECRQLEAEYRLTLTALSKTAPYSSRCTYLPRLAEGRR